MALVVEPSVYITHVWSAVSSMALSRFVGKSVDAAADALIAVVQFESSVPLAPLKAVGDILQKTRVVELELRSAEKPSFHEPIGTNNAHPFERKEPQFALLVVALAILSKDSILHFPFPAGKPKGILC